MRHLAVAATAATCLATAPSASAAIDPDVNSKRLRDAVTVTGQLEHMRALQRIANLNGGTRAAGTPGYAASGNYVARRLRAAGFEVTFQGFSFPFFQEIAAAELSRTAPAPKDYADTDFGTMQYSGSGDVTAAVQAVDVVLPPGPTPSSNTSGCEDADFAGFTPGNIALIQRGTCLFADKALNAQEAGAAGVIIFNEGQPGRTDSIAGSTLGGPGITIPVVGASFAVGNELASQPSTVRLFTSTFSERRITYNVLADTPGGREDQLVVVGAHLDSVLEGPGINDNGSGVATLLETAEEMSELGINPRRKVRFAFWGAEESGLLGSEIYVERLTDEEIGRHYANLNFDMLGSPNYARFVYDGDGSATPDNGPPGSAEIERVFNNYFAGMGLASEPTAFDGRSDYGPFILAGIPAGGLFSGAEGVKTAEQAARYGGTAGVAFDPCYHQACDDITNVSTDAIFELGDAAVHAIFALARSRSGLYPDERRARSRARVSRMYQFDYKGSHLIR